MRRKIRGEENQGNSQAISENFSRAKNYALKQIKNFIEFSSNNIFDDLLS